MGKKDTKSASSPSASPGQAAVETIDLSKLTPAQLAALQKQMKEKRKAAQGDSKERFAIIDTMLAEKNEDGSFKHTTRDILLKLQQEKLVDESENDFGPREIKKIQARKQFLEKKRDEKGELVYPPNTFGYKASEHVGFGLTGARVVKFFTEEDGASKLTDEQKKAVIAALS